MRCVQEKEKREMTINIALAFLTKIVNPRDLRVYVVYRSRERGPIPFLSLLCRAFSNILYNSPLRYFSIYRDRSILDTLAHTSFFERRSNRCTCEIRFVGKVE